MIKYLFFFLIIILAVGGRIFLGRRYVFNARNTKEMSAYKGTELSVKKDLGKVLVVYYSYSGNTRDIAMKIKEMTNADTYEIEVLKDYPSVPKAYAVMRKELKEHDYPEIKDKSLNLEGYDVVFVGTPIWWFTASTPVMSFLESHDFKDRKVVPFATHNGEPGKFYEDFKEKAKNANILEGRVFFRPSREDETLLNNKIADWINNLSV